MMLQLSLISIHLAYDMSKVPSRDGSSNVFCTSESIKLNDPQFTKITEKEKQISCLRSWSPRTVSLLLHLKKGTLMMKLWVFVLGNIEELIQRKL